MALSVAPETPAPSFSPSLAAPSAAAEEQLTAELLRTRKARLQDARSIHRLIDSFTSDGTLLRRSYVEIWANIHTFTIVESSSRQFIGCAALHVYGRHLAEIRSIVVHPDAKGLGGGSLLVQALLDDAKAAGIECVCLFTRIPAFFEHFHFRIAERNALHDKVLKDCVHCARRNACDEVAMAVGELPALHAIPARSFFHSRHHADLVQLQL
jgi:amino-acid N-acetyltransferase